MYPVDLPAVDETDLTSASEQYICSLESRPLNNEWFQSSQMSKVAITANNVRRLQLFEDDQPDCTVLALHPPDDPTRVAALYLHEKWWCVDDVLRTSNKSRSGLMMVQSIMERVIVFLLSQVVERSSQEEGLFSLHPRTESCKLLWRDSQAVGFYTVKHKGVHVDPKGLVQMTTYTSWRPSQQHGHGNFKGSLCDSWSTRCYLLPVLDTVLVRRSWRRRGFGLQMLEDLCSSFSTEGFLGVSSPLSPNMVAVCRRFLQQHEEHRDRLYEVEAPGGWTQRRNIWLNLKLGRYSVDGNESSPTSGETQRNEDDSSQKMQTSNCRMDLTSLSTCNVNVPLVIRSSEQQIKPCDPSQGRISPSSKSSQTGCSSAAHANDPDPGSPTRPAVSVNTKQALKSQASLSAECCREKPGETQRSVKRVRRT